MRILRVSDSIYEENSYIVIKDNDVTIIDPGFNYQKIVNFLDSKSLTLSRILLTHGHIDHIGEIDKLSNKYKDIEIYIHSKDSNFLFDESLNCSKYFKNPKKFSSSLNIISLNDEISEVAGFKIIHTPGHTIGSSIIKIEDNLFTGDTLFKGSVGRSDLPTGDEKELSKSLEYIKKSFSKKTIIYPGHYEKTTLKDELKTNIYLVKKHKKEL